MSSSVSAPPTPLVPMMSKSIGGLPTPYSPSFPSELPRSARLLSLKSYSFDFGPDDLKTPLTPPAAYMDFLRSALVAQTPTSATFSKDITSVPLSAGCHCRSYPKSSSRTTTSSTVDSKLSSTRSNSSRESSTSSTDSYTFQVPPTPLRTPLSATKRLRIPPSPAFSPGLGKMTLCDSPVAIYSATPRTPIEEEDEDEDDDREEEESEEPAIKSAPLTASLPSSCRYHRKVFVRTTGSKAMLKTAKMSLMPAPKGKKRRTE